jgi:hypothetical protein
MLPLKQAKLGTVLIVFSPVVALGFGSEVFFPVAITSALGGVICLICKSLTSQRVIRRITTELVHDLVSADIDRRNPVLSELDPVERQLFVLEIARIEAFSMSGQHSSGSKQIKVSAGSPLPVL